MQGRRCSVTELAYQVRNGRRALFEEPILWQPHNYLLHCITQGWVLHNRDAESLSKECNHPVKINRIIGYTNTEDQKGMQSTGKDEQNPWLHKHKGECNHLVKINRITSYINSEGQKVNFVPQAMQNHYSKEAWSQLSDARLIAAAQKEISLQQAMLSISKHSMQHSHDIIIHYYAGPDTCKIAQSQNRRGKSSSLLPHGGMLVAMEQDPLCMYAHDYVSSQSHNREVASW